MYEYIKGTLADITPTYAVVETHGIGYHIHIPFSTYTSSPQLGKECKLYLTAIYREDSQRLFGFLEIEERDLFLKLSDVSGIGPKTALNLIGHITMSELIIAIQHGNIKQLSKVPGIGKKTAERVVMEMRDKIKGLKSQPNFQNATASGESSQFNDGVGALLNLGYSLAISQKAIEKAQKALGEDAKLPMLITKALQNV